MPTTKFNCKTPGDATKLIETVKSHMARGAAISSYSFPGGFENTSAPVLVTVTGMTAVVWDVARKSGAELLPNLKPWEKQS
jgi:hypothetical protein